MKALEQRRGPRLVVVGRVSWFIGVIPRLYYASTHGALPTVEGIRLMGRPFESLRYFEGHAQALRSHPRASGDEYAGRVHAKRLGPQITQGRE
jgi:hypothetical protein